MLTCNGMAKDSKTHNSKYMILSAAGEDINGGYSWRRRRKDDEIRFYNSYGSAWKRCDCRGFAWKRGGSGGTEEGFDAIPMWVADMNFATVPTVQQEMIERASHPAFGYFEPREEYFSSIIKWQETRNGVKGLEKKHIGYENGVLGGLISAVSAFSAPGDAILLHSPTYIGFTRCIENSGRKIILSPLKKDENGVWRMDYEDMEAKIQKNRIHLAVFCNPHNRVVVCGRKDEIEKADGVYKRHSCVSNFR